MLKYSLLDAHQQDLVDRIYSHDENFIYATMGSGKTVCYLTAVDELLAAETFKRCLIVAPLRPALDVWAHEHKKWEHLEHLHVAVAVGTPAKRKAAIESDANVVVINNENLVWFLDKYGKTHGFDMLCIDELSKYGDNSSKTVKALRKYSGSFKHRTGLTGSPVHESMERLFSQVAVLDCGKRYGKNKMKFLQAYFYALDYEQRNWELLAGKRDEMLGKLSGLLYAMPDYTHTLPPITEHQVVFNLTEDNLRQYNKFSRSYVLQVGDSMTFDAEGMIVDDENVVVAENAAVLSGKLEQVTSGFVYDGDDCIELSTERLENFISLRQKLAGERCLVFYTFEEEKTQIISALKENYLTLKDKNAVDLWNGKQVENLLMHPKSASHGLNLAEGGNTIICYSPIWSNDMFKQLVARLWRRGQTREVHVYILKCDDTVDDIKTLRLDDKQEYDRLLREHIHTRP